MVTNSPAGARFGFLYRIRPDTNAGSVSLVYLCLYWPAAAKPESAAGKCEMISTIKLP